MLTSFFFFFLPFTLFLLTSVHCFLPDFSHTFPSPAHPKIFLTPIFIFLHVPPTATCTQYYYSQWPTIPTTFPVIPIYNNWFYPHNLHFVDYPEDGGSMPLQN